VLLVIVIMVGYYRMSGALAVAAPHPLLPVHTGRPRALRLHSDIARSRRVCAVDRHRGGRERADLRAHPRRAGPRQVAAPAVDDGFLHAMNAIVDSNVSTALTALILYAVGTGPVQGFAITLIIGIAPR